MSRRRRRRIGWEWGLPFLQYGPEWRKQRRIIWQQFHPGVIPKYHPALIEGARRLVLRLLDDPDRLPEHILYAIGGTIVEATYGLTVAAEDDKYITIANRSVQDVHRLVSISAMVFQALPALARVPTWLPLPGVGILRALEEARMWAKKMRNESWEDAKAATEKGSAKPSTVSLMIENMTHLSPEDAAREEESCKSVGAVIYSAGIDTTYSIISAFFMAMALHPEVQQKARAELDAVVGGARLPTFSDRENLPYVNAILREVGRWHVVAPMGFPRATTEDDEYKGYFIAKGTAVIVNAWAILHNRELYPDPDAFKPERFLKDGKIDPDIMDPSSVSFGLGRRGCPGRHLAEASAFIYMAFVLQNLVISRPLGEDGEPIPFEPSVRGDIIIAFKDLRCVIKPRSESTLTLIRQDDSSM
ncbi:cytochrome P450 [Epithele typhae]|uniref:cytochrome P450 n=1 Tax=Epithele typhae TaxID=378194 RepID=UPI0020084C48|nr:cytochrome P450 [Epithele typhae]KAH9924335.1 cytochrome P450 [Epithele typhae]